MMRIQYSNFDQFYDGIRELVKRNITFKADHDSLVITIIGVS